MTPERIKRAMLLWISLVCMAQLAACKSEPRIEKEPRPVRVLTVGSVREIEGLPYPGRAKANQEVNLSFRVPGRLAVLDTKVGDVVKAGDVLARLDPRDYENDLRTSEARLERARAQLALATSEYDRVAKTFQEDPGAISQVTVDQKLQARNEAAAEVKALEAVVAVARDILSDTYLRAPFDGTIVSKYVENYEDVQAKQAILRLLDASKIEMVVNVPESVIVNLPYVRSIEVTFDALPGQAVSATVEEVGTEASGTTRTYPITLIMPQPADARILPGMTGVARARGAVPTSGPEHQGVDVPASAIFEAADGSKCVWIVEPDGPAVRRQVVEVGPLTRYGVRVDGLEPGQKIVVSGAHYLQDGQAVRILDESQAKSISRDGQADRTSTGE